MSDIDQALSSARVHLRAGRLAEASALHVLLTTLRPDEAEGWYRSGHILIELGSDAQAASCFRQCLSHNPAHRGARFELDRLAEARLVQAEAEQAAGFPTAAIRILGEAVLLCPNDRRIHAALLRIAISAMPEGGTSSQSGAEQTYDSWLIERERELCAAAQAAGDTAAATLRSGRLGVFFGEPMVAPVTVNAAGAAPLLVAAQRLAASRRFEDALGCVRRALKLTDDLAGTRDLLERLKAQLFTAGPRLMPGIGVVDLRPEGEVWRLVPEKADRIALVVSVPRLAILDQDDPYLDNHGPWETRQVVRGLLAAGYTVDVTHIHNPQLPPVVPDYDVAMSVHGPVMSLAERLSASTLKVAWLTTSSPDYQNRREHERIAAMTARGREGYAASRQLDVENDLAVLEWADRCIFLGNQHTLATFPAAYHAKMTGLVPTASRLSVLPPIELLQGPPEFVWMGGGGSVLKGLDIALEAFVTMPEFLLHVVGSAAEEPDFNRLYGEELYRLPNIRLHGYQRTSSAELAAILARASFVIAPSASEGGSTSLATCLTAGLFPIVSDATGLDYEEGAVIRLRALTVEAIVEAVRLAAAMPVEQLATIRDAIRTKATALYGRDRYLRDLVAIVRSWRESQPRSDAQ